MTHQTLYHGHSEKHIYNKLVQARDIYQSSIDSSSKDRRLLRLNLTDGHTEVIAIECSPIPSINEPIIPGTKVLLQSKIPVRNGILCLSSNVVKIIGGVVQSLFDEWNVSQKYSGFSRSSQGVDGSGPPAFEKLRLEAYTSEPEALYRSVKTRHQSPQHSFSRKESGDKNVLSMESKTGDGAHSNLAASKTGMVKNTDLRPKEVVEAVPVQNQAATQKLLQKLNQSDLENRHCRGGRHRDRGREETAVFTLDEWERRKAGTLKSPGASSAAQDTSRDEELARQLQNQLDMEEFYAEERPDAAAEHLKLSMFSYGRSEGSSDQGREYGRRGRGRRSRGRGR
ncbi:tudor domain protein (DUF1767) isoform X2 [Wolffia australiana]